MHHLHNGQLYFYFFSFIHIKKTLFTYNASLFRDQRNIKLLIFFFLLKTNGSRTTSYDSRGRPGLQNVISHQEELQLVHILNRCKLKQMCPVGRVMSPSNFFARLCHISGTVYVISYSLPHGTTTIFRQNYFSVTNKLFYMHHVYDGQFQSLLHGTTTVFK